LSRIVVSEFPSGDIAGWQIAIDDTNRYVYRFGAVEERGTIPFSPWAARLSASAELRLLHPLSGKVPPGSYLFWIEGRRVLAPEIPMEGGAFADLRAFASDLHDAAAADALKHNAPRIKALLSLHDLSAIAIESHGCYGPCGIYTLTFARTGAAAIVWPTPPGLWRSEPYTVRSRAPANWDAVIAALHAAHVERLEPRYQIRAVDTASATLRFRFRTWTYTVEGPDSMAWPREFRAAFGTLRGLAATARWSPRFTAEQLDALRPRRR